MKRALGLAAVLAGLAQGLAAAVSQTSYASWYDANPSGQFGHVNLYALQANTTLQLYRVNTENTSIATLVATYGPSGAANQPYHYPTTGPNDHSTNWYNGTAQAFYRLVASHPTAPASSNLVNWDLNSPDKNSYLDSHTFLVSETGTYAGALFHTWLFHHDTNPGSSAEGMGLAVVNTSAGPVNVQVNRWNGVAWVAAPVPTGTGANSVAGLAAGRIWMYGGVSQANSGDFQVVVTGGNALVYKGNMFELDHDNAFMMMADASGNKQGRLLYGAMSSTTYSTNPGNLVLTALGGASIVDVYTYSHSGNNAFPAAAGGTWTLWAPGVNIAANSTVSLSGNMGGLTPLAGNGQFVRVQVVAGADVQAGVGSNIMSGVAGDGDWIPAADTGRALGRSFLVANGNYDNAFLSNNAYPRIVVIAPTAGTAVSVASPAAPAKPLQTWTSGGADQAHSFDMALSSAAADMSRVWTVSSSQNVYVFLETAGTPSNEMEKMYSAVAPVPGVDLQVFKSVNKTAANPGDTLTYVLTLVNVGSQDAVNAELWDTLPGGLVSVADNQGGFLTSPGSPGVSARIWTLPSLAAGGGSFSVTVTAQIDPAMPNGSRVFANSASAFAANDPRVRGLDRPVLSYAVQAANSCWEGYSAWEDNPPSGSQNEAYVHVYGLRDGTTVNLYRAASGNTGSTIGALESSFSLGAGQSSAIGPINTRFYRISSNYPVVWELDSLNVSDRHGHDMMVYSTDMKYADKAPFLTYMDYYHKTGCGTPDCPANSGLGDALVVVNPSQSQTAKFQVFNSFDSGATWNFVGDYSAGVEGAVLVGGTTQATDGDYLVVPYGDAASQGGDLIVYKGSAISLNSQSLNDGGGGFGASNLGSRSAVATGDRIYGLASAQPSSTVLVTGQTGTANYEVFRYVPASGATPNWPMAGNSGTWTSVATGSVTAGAAPGTFTAPAKGLYKVVKTGGAGSFTAAFGGAMYRDFGYGDGDMVGSVDNAGADWLASGGTQALQRGRDFTFSSGSSAGGTIVVTAPNSGTSVTVTGSLNTGGGFSSQTNGTPAPSGAAYTVWRFLTQGTNQAYRVQASQDVYVTYQSPSTDHEAKAFGGSPLVLCITPTPTPSPTVSSTPTPSPSPSNTPSASPTRTASPSPSNTPSSSSTPSPSPSNTPSPSPSLTATPSATPSNSPTLTATPSATPTFTPSVTATPSSSSSATPTFSATPTATPTHSPTYSITETNTPGPSPTYSNTPSGTPTATDSPSITSTSSPSPTASATPTFSATASITPSITVTVPFSPTNTPTHTPSSTVSPSFTQTPTFTATWTTSATPTQSSSFTASPSSTQTPTPSPTPTTTSSATATATTTPTATPTLSFSASPTISTSPTVSPTPTLPAPFLMEVAVYNSAGELVGLVASGLGAYQAPVGLSPLTPNFSPGDSSALVVVEGPGLVLAWDGRNRSGQVVGNGTYTIQVKVRDPFGTVTAYTQAVTVVHQGGGVSIEVFNSAGERVRSLPGQPSFSPGLSQLSAASFSPEDGAGAGGVDLSWGTGSLRWDGRNDQGQVVQPGSYHFVVRDAKSGETAVREVSVLGRPLPAPEAVLVGGLLRPGKAAVVALLGGSPGDRVRVRVYNSAGELVSALSEDPASPGRLLWRPLSGLASGTYVLVVEVHTAQGGLTRRVLKAALVR